MTKGYYTVGTQRVSTLAEAKAISERTGLGYSCHYEPVPEEKSTERLAFEEKNRKAVAENLQKHGTVMR